VFYVRCIYHALEVSFFLNVQWSEPCRCISRRRCAQALPADEWMDGRMDDDVSSKPPPHT
jgi:hypothetical protein